jgi:hypothetical protein
VNKLTLLWDDTKAQVKAWFGVKPQNRFVMGDVCLTPPPPTMPAGKPAAQPGSVGQ